MTLWPYIQNVLSKSFQWPLFYLLTEDKCYKRFIHPRGSLSMTLIPNYLAEQIESTVRIWIETSLFCPRYSTHIWKAALKDRSTPLESFRFYFYPLFCLSSSKKVHPSELHTPFPAYAAQCYDPTGSWECSHSATAFCTSSDISLDGSGQIMSKTHQSNREVRKGWAAFQPGTVLSVSCCSLTGRWLSSASSL